MVDTESEEYQNMLLKNLSNEAMEQHYARKGLCLFEFDKPDEVYFSQFNTHMLGKYLHLKTNWKQQVAVGIQNFLDRHNDSSERSKVNLYLFN